jgi:hypothetical protein
MNNCDEFMLTSEANVLGYGGISKDYLTYLLESSARGDPESPLKWTKKSLHNLKEELRSMGHEISHMTVHRLRC